MRVRGMCVCVRACVYLNVCVCVCVCAPPLLLDLAVTAVAFREISLDHDLLVAEVLVYVQFQHGMQKCPRSPGA